MFTSSYRTRSHRRSRAFRRLRVEHLETRAMLAVTGVGDVVVELFAEDVQQGPGQGPTDLALDSQGNLFVTTSRGTSHAMKIFKFPAGTNTPELFGEIAVPDPDGVAVDSFDNLIVSGAPVTKFAPDGSVVWQLNVSGNPQLSTVDADDNIYVGTVGTVVHKIAPDGTSSTALGPFDGPDVAAVGPDGFLYVRQRNPLNIVKASVDTGEIFEVVVSGVRAVHSFDSSGDLLIADALSGTIKKWSISDGTISTIATGFARPAGAAVDADGNIFVIDAEEQTIYKLFPNGVSNIDVTIDIKPGSPENTINLGSNGVVPVAILSSSTFDATTIDAATVTLADAGVKLRGNGTPQTTQQDVNNDGLTDLVVHILSDALELTAGDETATLTGQTTSGDAIEGTDFVRIVAALRGEVFGDALAEQLSIASLDMLTEIVMADLTRELGSAAEPTVEFVAADLPAGVLGRTELLPLTASGPDGRITLDVTANGAGWFIDVTPLENSEFSVVEGGSLMAMPDTEAAGHYDLVTALNHELGHLFGLGHDDHGLMATTLPLGVRRLEANQQTELTPLLDAPLGLPRPMLSVGGRNHQHRDHAQISDIEVLDSHAGEFYELARYPLVAPTQDVIDRAMVWYSSNHEDDDETGGGLLGDLFVDEFMNSHGE